MNYQDWMASRKTQEGNWRLEIEERKGWHWKRTKDTKVETEHTGGSSWSRCNTQWLIWGKKRISVKTGMNACQGCRKYSRNKLKEEQEEIVEEMLVGFAKPEREWILRLRIDGEDEHEGSTTINILYNTLMRSFSVQL